MTPRAEIVTMNRAGLDAFIHELKRVKTQHQHPEIPEGKLDEAVAHWEQQQRETVQRVRERADARLLADDDDDTSGLTHSIARSNAKILKLTFASVRHYLGNLNRDINQGRVSAYWTDMEQGKWWFSPDPIVVTDTGDIINGQHRLLAVEGALGKGEITDETAPTFVVVWGVDKKAAILMDEARRTSTDRRDIALRYAGSR